MFVEPGIKYSSKLRRSDTGNNWFTQFIMSLLRSLYQQGGLSINMTLLRSLPRCLH